MYVLLLVAVLERDDEHNADGILTLSIITLGAQMFHWNWTLALHRGHSHTLSNLLFINSSPLVPNLFPLFSFSPFPGVRPVGLANDYRQDKEIGARRHSWNAGIVGVTARGNGGNCQSLLGERRRQRGRRGWWRLKTRSCTILSPDFLVL